MQAWHGHWVHTNFCGTQPSTTASFSGQTRSPCGTTLSRSPSFLGSLLMRSGWKVQGRAAGGQGPSPKVCSHRLFAAHTQGSAPSLQLLPARSLLVICLCRFAEQHGLTCGRGFPCFTFTQCCCTVPRQVAPGRGCQAWLVQCPEGCWFLAPAMQTLWEIGEPLQGGTVGLFWSMACSAPGPCLARGRCLSSVLGDVG